jgi:hypothetical protein
MSVQPAQGPGEVPDLDTRSLLLAAGEAKAAEHAAQVRSLEACLDFAALHSGDPRQGRGGPPTLADAKEQGMTRAEWERGATKLVRLGGDGTPQVQDLPLCELAVAQGVHETAARNEVADALDLAHRLRGTWADLQGGRGHVWVARKVARMSRHLNRHQIRIVDEAVAGALDEAPARVLAIAEAAILRADPEHGREAEDERRRGRTCAFGRLDEDGLRAVFGRIDAGDADCLEAMVDRVADALEERPDLAQCSSREELRAEALGWLAHPDEVNRLLTGEEPPRTAGARQRAVLHVHFSQTDVAARLADAGEGVVARVEELGPRLYDDVCRLLGRVDIDLKPVIDLNTVHSVNQYEHPVDVKERGFLRTTGDVFPHAQSQSRRLDNDHPDPYDAQGPPGQTGDLNHAPLGRRGHRAKTHQGYRLRQLGPGIYLWRTPHGLLRLVDGSGTHALDSVVQL